MGSYSSDSLSKSEFNYGDDGYMFEPTRSDDTAGNVCLIGNESAALDQMLDTLWCMCGLCSNAFSGTLFYVKHSS